MNNGQNRGASNVLYLAIAGIIGYSLIRQGVSAGQLLWYADGIQSLRFENATPVLTVRARVMNTGNVTYTINAFAADVEANDTIVGNASFFNPQVIAARSQGILLISIRLMPLSIVNDLVTAFQTKNFQYKIEVNGTANVNNIQFPVNLKYNVGY